MSRGNIKRQQVTSGYWQRLRQDAGRQLAVTEVQNWSLSLLIFYNKFIKKIKLKLEWSSNIIIWFAGT
jgi:hypothetical protein